MRSAACVVLAFAVTAHAGPEWTEMGDAGSLPSDAQTPMSPGDGPIAIINGNLTGDPGGRGVPDFEDVYRIVIKDFENFSAFIVPNVSGATTFDTQLFLFDEFGLGILGNDDVAGASPNGESGFGNMATDGSGAAVTQNGVYFLAISGAGNAPLNPLDEPIFNFADPFEVSGPDGSFPPELFNWSGPGAIGEYTIQLTGASFLPAPGAAGLLALAGLSVTRRRRAV